MPQKCSLKNKTHLTQNAIYDKQYDLRVKIV